MQSSLDVNRQVAEVLNGLEIDLTKMHKENSELKAEREGWGKERGALLADEQNSEIKMESQGDEIRRQRGVLEGLGREILRKNESLEF